MRRARAALIVTAVMAVGGGCGQPHLGSTDDEAARMRTALRAAVSIARPPFVTADAEGNRLWKRTCKFYERRQYEAAWIEGSAPRPQLDALINAIRAADREGLDPELYGVSALEARRTDASKGFLTKRGFAPGDATSMDVWLTYLYMKYASDLADGLSDLAHADPAWRIEPESFDPLEHLERALVGSRVAESLRELTPTDPQYQALRKALQDHREQAARGGWPTLPRVLRIKPGQQSVAVGLLATRLAASRDYMGALDTDGDALTYGPDLQEAVKRFQRRHGLQDDGVIGAAVIAEMNVPIEERIRQIELNLERWRWLPRDLGARHIIVNIPAYRLEVWENGKVALSMRIVVGKKDSPTPIFSDDMTYLVFSPYWNVPPSIARDETLPSVMKDAAFLQRTNMEVIDTDGRSVDPSSIDLGDPTKYRFRQRPGGGNSLGMVKFMFPNQYNVYLHDTPADSLFARASRSFSHGCVRIEDPVSLAAYVLHDQPVWTRERIAEAMHGEDERIVKLREPLPVYLGYWTASVAPDGFVQFTHDVYGIDARQTAKVAERLARLKKTSLAATSASDALYEVRSTK